MTVCNFCKKRESRSCIFEKPYVCKECCNDKDNYVDDDDSIIFIDSRNKRRKISIDAELDITNDSDIDKK